MAKIKRVDITPNNQHWMDYKIAHKLPVNNPSNCIKISNGNLRRLRAAVRKTGGKLEIDS